MEIRLLALAACVLACLPALAQQDAATPSSAGRPPDVATTTNGNPTPPSIEPASPPAPPDLTPDAHGKLSPDQMRELTRVVAQNFRDNFKKQRDYTFVERDVEHNVSGDGKVKSTEIHTYDVIEIYGQEVWRMIEKDDKPLDAKDAAKE